FNEHTEHDLGNEQENNRLGELQELFEKGRSAPVDFSGLVATQNANQWSVSGVNVLISPQTKLPQNAILVGTGIRVVGYAQNGIVEAESVELISINSVDMASQTSPADNGSNLDPNHQGSTPQSTEPSSTQVPVAIVNPVETTNPNSQSSNSFKGIVQSVSGDVWTINGVQVNVSAAEISGIYAYGGVVKVEGYFDQNGVFIATRIELPEDNNNSNNNDDDSSGSTTSSGGTTQTVPSPVPTQSYNDNNDDNHNYPTKTPDGSYQHNNDDDNHVYATQTPEADH
ncbi:MAG: DUF5666 domain-containing protein, partial [Chloroflexota bacterium]